MKRFMSCLVGLILLALFGVARAQDPGNAAAEAASIVTKAEIEMIGARGAVQVSQIADQAQLKLSVILIKQNDEMVKLLREILKKTK